MKTAALAAAIAFGLGTAGGVQASVVYDESVDGDLTVGSLVSLGFGSNIIKGNIRGSAVGQIGTADFDIFDASLPSESILVSIAYQLTGAGGLPLLFRAADADGIIVAQSPISESFSSSINLPVAADRITLIGFNGLPADVNYDYEIELEVGRVAPVPLPASALLLLAGFGGLAVMRRRQTQQET